VPKWPTVTSQFKSLTSCFIRTRQIYFTWELVHYVIIPPFPDCGGRRRSNSLFGVRTALSRRPDRALCSCFDKKPNRDLDRKLVSTAVKSGLDVKMGQYNVQMVGARWLPYRPHHMMPRKSQGALMLRLKLVKIRCDDLSEWPSIYLYQLF
jgi:hypothetical protein